MSTIPKLLKARQTHSRIFALIFVLLLLISAPEANTIIPLLMVWFGYVLVIIGALGRAYSSLYIGGRKNDVVVRQGPFSVVRNPLYVFSFIALVGIGLESQMVSLLAILVAAFVLYYPLVVAKEEAFLKNKFGEEYEKYLREVPRWLPNFKLWSEPEHVEAMPKFVRRTLMDAAIFFLPMIGFVLVSYLQFAHWLPVWLTLP